jgi:hypothetical protein
MRRRRPQGQLAPALLREMVRIIESDAELRDRGWAAGSSGNLRELRVIMEEVADRARSVLQKRRKTRASARDTQKERRTI